MNYLIDECMVASKGANTVISLLHHFLEHHSLGEQSVHLHADNCSGQNKNNFMVQVILIVHVHTVMNHKVIFHPVVDVACAYWPPPVCHSVIHDGGTHQICS